MIHSNPTSQTNNSNYDSSAREPILALLEAFLPAVEAGVANANFFYSISLVGAAGHVAALAAALAAAGAAGGPAPRAKPG